MGLAGVPIGVAHTRLARQVAGVGVIRVALLGVVALVLAACLSTPPGFGEFLVLVDSLRSGLLDEKQVATVRQLRVGLSALAEKEDAIKDVKVQSAEN